jgi:hypothetical protein
VLQVKQLSEITLQEGETATALSLTLRPEARAPFAAWLDELQEQGRSLVLVAGNEPILRSRPPRGARAAAGWTLSGVTLAELCTSTTTLTLPADLTP